MDHEDYERADAIGNIRKVEVLGVEALGRFVVLEIEAGPADGSKGMRLGKWTLPLEVARDLVEDLLLELRDRDERPPETPN